MVVALVALLRMTIFTMHEQSMAFLKNGAREVER